MDGTICSEGCPVVVTGIAFEGFSEGAEVVAGEGSGVGCGGTTIAKDDKSATSEHMHE